jgi:hypothetical protein
MENSILLELIDDLDVINVTSEVEEVVGYANDEEFMVEVTYDISEEIIDETQHRDSCVYQMQNRFRVFDVRVFDEDGFESLLTPEQSNDAKNELERKSKIVEFTTLTVYK